jgi:hypothetical protein
MTSSVVGREMTPSLAVPATIIYTVKPATICSTVDKETMSYLAARAMIGFMAGSGVTGITAGLEATKSSLVGNPQTEAGIRAKMMIGTIVITAKACVDRQDSQWKETK